MNEGYANIFSCCMLRVCVCVFVFEGINRKQCAGHYLTFCLECDLHLPLNKPPSVCLSGSAALIFPPSTAMPFIRVIFMKKDNKKKKQLSPAYMKDLIKCLKVAGQMVLCEFNKAENGSSRPKVQTEENMMLVI